MRTVWQEYSVPIAVTCGGLVLAALLGIAPLIGRNAPAPAAAAPASTVQAAPVVQADPDAMQAIEAALAQQAQALDSLGNRIQTLEKGITRMNQKVAGQGRALDGLSDVGADVARSQGELAILNKAVPRMNAKLQAQGDALESLAEMGPDVARSKGELAILNKAVPRMNIKLQAQGDALESLSELGPMLLGAKSRLRS